MIIWAGDVIVSLQSCHALCTKCRQTRIRQLQPPERSHEMGLLEFHKIGALQQGIESVGIKVHQATVISSRSVVENLRDTFLENTVQLHQRLPVLRGLEQVLQKAKLRIREHWFNVSVALSDSWCTPRGAAPPRFKSPRGGPDFHA